MSQNATGNEISNEQIVNDFVNIFQMINPKLKDNPFLIKLYNNKSYNKNESYELLELCANKLYNLDIVNIDMSHKYKNYCMYEYLCQLVQCSIGNKLLSTNLYLLKFIDINKIVKLVNKCKFNNFKIIYKYLEDSNYLNKNNKKDIFINSTRNYDDRIFKFCVNNFKCIPNEELFFVNLLSRPIKFYFKRLKLVSKYLNDNTLLKKTLFRSTCYTDFNDSILNMFFKYYYTFELSEDDIGKLAYNMANKENLNILIYKKYLDYLKTTEEKNQFNLFSLIYGNIIISLKYLDFNSISSDNFYFLYRNLSKQFNFNSKELSYSFDIIIKKAIESNHFQLFLKNQKLLKGDNTAYYNIYGYPSDNKILYMLPYIKETRDTSNHHVNFLYIKLKRFIHRIRTNKNIKRDIQFKPVLFELMNYHSSKMKVQPLKENKIEFNKVPPTLMLPGEIEMINNFLIREKADGELVYKLPNNIEPPFNINCDVKAEYIEELDLYLVFDCNINMNVINKYNFLRNKHYMTSGKTLEIVNCMEELITAIKQERQLFETFLEKDYDNYRWYPKAAWNIITMNEQFINDIYNFVNEKSIYNKIILENDFYQNDGFIISLLDDLKEIKIKPRSLMTLDLEYNGENFIDRDNNTYDIKIDKSVKLQNGIYRCYPIDNHFIAKEIRYDKKKANPYDVINNIINLSKITYRIKSPIYYHDIDYKYSKSWQKIVKDNTSNLLNVNNFMYKNQNVLDLGCGKSKILKLGIDYTNYTGYDYDVYVLLKNMKSMRNKSINNVEFNYVDLTGDWNDTLDKFYDVKYKKYMNIYAINSLMHFNTNKFWEQIDKVSEKGTRFLFNIIQSKTNKDIYWVENNSYLKQNDDKIELYFENIHSKPLIEKYITIKDVEKYLKKYGFDIIYKYSSSNYNITDLYEWYVCEKIV
tara:strand:+ start:6762 stop:9527 length:2766 start_codon:yes stop_codon:yes gene_type:complete